MPINDTDTCWPVKTPIMYTLNSYGKLRAPHGRVVEAMMSEIYANGPITCGVSCPEDFVYNYRSGVFRDNTNDTEIDHGARRRTVAELASGFLISLATWNFDARALASAALMTDHVWRCCLEFCRVAFRLRTR